MSNGRTPENLRRFLDIRGIDFQQCVKAFRVTGEDSVYVRLARRRCHDANHVERYGTADDDSPHTQFARRRADDEVIDLDEDPVLLASENGVSVLAWVWISKSAAFPNPLMALSAAFATSGGRSYAKTSELAAQREWLIETCLRREEAINTLAAVRVTPDCDPPLIEWKFGDAIHRFLPSTAVRALLKASPPWLDEAHRAADEEFIAKFGRALDVALGDPEKRHSDTATV